MPKDLNDWLPLLSAIVSVVLSYATVRAKVNEVESRLRELSEKQKEDHKESLTKIDNCRSEWHVEVVRSSKEGDDLKEWLDQKFEDQNKMLREFLVDYAATKATVQTSAAEIERLRTSHHNISSRVAAIDLERQRRG